MYAAEMRHTELLFDARTPRFGLEFVIVELSNQCETKREWKPRAVFKRSTKFDG